MCARFGYSVAEMRRNVPADFDRRLKAARFFGGFSTPKALAEAMGQPRAERSLKNYEAGRRSDSPHGSGPRSSETPDLISRLSTATGMPESFLWGDWPPREGVAPNGSATLTQELQAELLVRVAEASQRIEAVGTAISQLPPAQQQ